MSRYAGRDWDDDDFGVRGRTQRRDLSPDLTPPRLRDNGAYISGANPAHGRLAYDDRPPAPYQDSDALQVPSSQHRPRSLPPLQHALVPRPPPYGRPASRSPPRHGDGYDLERSRRRSPSTGPVDQVRSAVDKTFSTSTSGLGVSLLGAVVGGIAAREMSSAALRTRSKKELNDAMNGTNSYSDDRNDGPVYYPPHPRARRSSSSATKKEADKSRLVSTVVGAIVGGLGANAIERRFESSRHRHREEQEAWERKWGHRDEQDDRNDSRRSGERRYPVGRRDDYWEGDHLADDRRRGFRRTESEERQERQYRW